MGSEGSNMSGEIAHLRDTFFGVKNFDISELRKKESGNGEIDYLREILLTKPNAMRIFKKLRTTNPRKLYNEAVKRMDMIEYGQVKPENLEQVEAEIALLLGAIEDLQMVKILEKTFEPSDNEREM